MNPPVLPAVVTRRRRRRMLLAFGIIFFVLIVLPVSLYVEENARGARAWARCRQELTDRGERLDRAAFIPPDVPDAENFALADPLPTLLAYCDDAGRLRMGKEQPPLYKTLRDAVKNISGRPPPPGVDWRTGRGLNLDALANYLQGQDKKSSAAPFRPAAETVRDALAPFAPTLDALAGGAASRPAARFPLDYDAAFASTISQPHLVLLQSFVRLLQLRALANLDDGHTGESLADLRLIFRIADAINGEPLLITHLVHNTCLGFALNVVWQGLADRRWSADELTEVSTLLGHPDVLARCAHALRAERGFFYLNFIDYFERRGGRDFTAVPGQELSPAARGLMKALPHGWYDQNRAVGCWLIQGLLDGLNPAAHRVDPRRSETYEKGVEGLRHRFTPGVWFAQVALPALDAIPLTAARVQTGLDHAIAACALERHHLSNGDYPAALDALAEAARLPHDIMDGAPLRYARTPDGRYRLWSVGWEGRDEGGRIVYKNQRPDFTLGDWAWQYTQPADAPKPPPSTPPASPPPTPVAPKPSRSP